jgi:hypothetical protein
MQPELGRERIHAIFWWGNLFENCNLEDGRGGRMITLSWTIFERKIVKMGGGWMKV